MSAEPRAPWGTIDQAEARPGRRDATRKLGLFSGGGQATSACTLALLSEGFGGSGYKVLPTSPRAMYQRAASTRAGSAGRQAPEYSPCRDEGRPASARASSAWGMGDKPRGSQGRRERPEALCPKRPQRGLASCHPSDNRHRSRKPKRACRPSGVCGRAKTMAKTKPWDRGTGHGSGRSNLKSATRSNRHLRRDCPFRRLSSRGVCGAFIIHQKIYNAAYTVLFLSLSTSSTHSRPRWHQNWPLTPHRPHNRRSRA